MKLSPKLFLALSVAGLGAAIATAPAQAQQAYASGSSTIVNFNGSSHSVGGEIGLPTGAYFEPSLTVETTLDSSITGADAFISTFNFTAGGGTASALSSLGGSTTFSAAAAAALNQWANASDLNGVVSIIRAGAGVDGLD